MHNPIRKNASTSYLTITCYYIFRQPTTLCKLENIYQFYASPLKTALSLYSPRKSYRTSFIPLLTRVQF